VVPGADGSWYPRPADFAVIGYAVVPRYQPSEVSIDLLQSQLTAVCTDPLWLDDSTLCTEFGDLLDLAEGDEDDSNFYGAAAVLARLQVRVSEEGSEMHPNAYWLLGLNVEQAHANALEAAEDAAWLFHFRTVSDTAVVAGGWAMWASAEATGAVAGSIAGASSEWFYFVRGLEVGTAFSDGDWSVQLELFEMSVNDAGLSLNDVRVQRYSGAGSLLETKHIHQGAVATLPAGDSRVSLTETLTGWGSGSSGDVLAVSFRLENEGTASETYAIRTGIAQAEWGASWLSQPCTGGC
jgi:hypothetical protein